MFAIIMNATPDADKAAAAFAMDNIEDDDWKKRASIFEKSGSTSSLIPAQAGYSR